MSEYIFPSTWSGDKCRAFVLSRLYPRAMFVANNDFIVLDLLRGYDGKQFVFTFSYQIHL